MLRRSKTDKRSGPSNRILVVDDNVDAARLLGKVLRQAGFEVAEIGDHETAITTLVDEPEPVGAIVASFSTLGTGACLRLLDNLRNHPEEKINTLRVLIVSDHPRQQLFCLQAGADALILRPYRAVELVEQVTAMLERDDEERLTFRRERIGVLKNQPPNPAEIANGLANGSLFP